MSILTGIAPDENTNSAMKHAASLNIDKRKFILKLAFQLRVQFHCRSLTNTQMAVVLTELSSLQFGRRVYAQLASDLFFACF